MLHCRGGDGRIIGPLTEMGATVTAGPGHRPPVVIHGADLTGIQFAPETPSAQVKSAVLLAGLQAAGQTRVIEPASTRDHTERALAAFGATVAIDGRAITLAWPAAARPKLARPGDLSSAHSGRWPPPPVRSDVTITDVGLNPSRAGLLDMLRRFGARVETTVENQCRRAGRPPARAARHDARPRDRAGGSARGDRRAARARHPRHVWRQCHRLGRRRAAGQGSDRIAELVAGLRAMGADAEERPDGFQVRAGRRLTGAPSTPITTTAWRWPLPLPHSGHRPHPD